MNLNFDGFWQATPHVIDKAIAVGLSVCCLGVGVAIGRSGKVAVNADGVLIERQAIANQENLEHSLFLIKSLQGIIERYEADTKEFSRIHKEGAELAEQVEFAAGFLPEQQIEKLEVKVQESRELLEEVLPLEQ